MSHLSLGLRCSTLIGCNAISRHCHLIVTVIPGFSTLPLLRLSHLMAAVISWELQSIWPPSPKSSGILTHLEVCTNIEKPNLPERLLLSYLSASRVCTCGNDDNNPREQLLMWDDSLLRTRFLLKYEVFSFILWFGVCCHAAYGQGNIPELYSSVSAMLFIYLSNTTCWLCYCHNPTTGEFFFLHPCWFKNKSLHWCTRYALRWWVSKMWYPGSPRDTKYAFFMSVRTIHFSFSVSVHFTASTLFSSCAIQSEGR